VAAANSLLLCLAARIAAAPAGSAAWPRRRGIGAAIATRGQRSSIGDLSDARGRVMSELLLDAAGRRRSPATLPQFHAGRAPRNKGMRYPADPPTIEEIIAVMRGARRQRPRPPTARVDRGALARRPAHPRGARARRGRP